MKTLKLHVHFVVARCLTRLHVHGALTWTSSDQSRILLELPHFCVYSGLSLSYHLPGNQNKWLIFQWTCSFLVKNDRQKYQLRRGIYTSFLVRRSRFLNTIFSSFVDDADSSNCPSLFFRRSFRKFSAIVLFSLKIHWNWRSQKGWWNQPGNLFLNFQPI